MKNYQSLIEDILTNGEWSENRTGTKTLSVIGRDLRWDLSKGFPLLTCKKMATKAIVGELLWFLSGSNDIQDLRYLTNLSDSDFCIWQKNLDQYNARIGRPGNTRLGTVYGQVWRGAYPQLDFDQIHWLVKAIKEVKENPSCSHARRLIVNAWVPEVHTDEHAYCALPPCHYGFQCFVRNGKLSLKWIQRSVDTFLGLPFNIASYALLTHILAKLTGLEVGELIFSGGDVHIYEDHVEQCKQLITLPTYDLCSVNLPEELNSLDQLTDQTFTAKDFTFSNYQSGPVIKGVMS